MTLKISDEPLIGFDRVVSWSPDGTKIAGHYWRYLGIDEEGEHIVEQGIFVVDVVFSSTGRPIGTANLQLVCTTISYSTVAWASDNRRIVYVDSVGDKLDVFVGDTLTGQSVNVTNTPDLHEEHPVFHPTEERIAYTRQVPLNNGYYRKDIFSIPASGGAETQLTSKGTTGQALKIEPAYSPDGLELAFAAGSETGDRAIYKIASDGTGKAVKLTGRNRGDFRRPRWRQ